MSSEIRVASGSGVLLSTIQRNSKRFQLLLDGSDSTVFISAETIFDIKVSNDLVLGVLFHNVTFFANVTT